MAGTSLYSKLFLSKLITNIYSIHPVDQGLVVLLQAAVEPNWLFSAVADVGIYWGTEPAPRLLIEVSGGRLGASGFRPRIELFAYLRLCRRASVQECFHWQVATGRIDRYEIDVSANTIQLGYFPNCGTSRLLGCDLRDLGSPPADLPDLHYKNS